MRLCYGSSMPVVLPTTGRSDVQSGLSFAPALRAHQCAQRSNGADRRQQKKARNEKKSTFHIVHRERAHFVTPLIVLIALFYHFNRFATRIHNAMVLLVIVFSRARSTGDRVASIHARLCSCCRVWHGGLGVEQCESLAWPLPKVQ
jgi:hypothetical protein